MTAICRLLEVAFYLAVPPITRGQVWPVLVSFALGSTLLLLGVWFRQAWARKVLLVFLFLSLLFEIMLIALHPEGLTRGSLLFATEMLAQLALFFLILSRNVKDYVSGR